MRTADGRVSAHAVVRLEMHLRRVQNNNTHSTEVI